MINYTNNPLLPTVIEENSNQSSEAVFQEYNSEYVELKSIEEVRGECEKKIRYCMYIFSAFLLFTVIFVICYCYLITR